MAMDAGVTWLLIAAVNGREKVVRALIEAGADINEAKDDGATALFMAYLDSNEAVVRALIVAGADVIKALLIAAEIGHEPVVQILRDASAV